MSDVLDSVYEAALVPELWPKVLDDICRLSGTWGGVLYVVTPQWTPDGTVSLSPVPRWTASPAAAGHVEAFVRDGWLHGNIRAERAIRVNHSGFVTDHDLFTELELETEPFYKYARDRGIGWHSGLTIQAPSGDVIIFNFERRRDDGPVDRETVARLDTLKPDLSRASLLSGRLGLERARGATEMLALLGLPAAVLSGRYSLLAANSLMDALMPAVVQERAEGRMRLADARADVLFMSALSQVQLSDRAGEATSAVLSIPVRATHDRPAMVIHVIPVRRTARDVFAMAACVVIVTPVSRADAPSATLIQGLFDLTAAEARIARRLGNGETISEIASSSNTSELTVRTQLKAVFAKNGVARQADLVGLLATINPVR